MSQNRELEFIEPEPGVWYYVLEDYSAPKNSWDWREHAQAYGPFESYEKANEHQYDYSRISTPGHTVTGQEHYKGNETFTRLIAEATLDQAH